MSQSETSCGKILRPCSFLISYLNAGHQIHPTEPVGPKHSEFLAVDDKKTVRIIHVAPDIRRTVRESNTEKPFSVSRLSLTEEYWFTRWNKPLQEGICNCSFRRSKSDRFLSSSVRHSKRSLHNVVSDVPATKIINVDTFVERLVQDTFFEAIQEYLMKKSIGIDNLGFNQAGEGVVLRRKCYRKHSSISLDDRSSVNQSNSSVPCSHKSGSNKHKPLVILLHGIGSMADVWWNVINKLLSRGYEVVAPDMLGHGYSSAPNNPSAYKFKNLLKNVLQVFDYYVTTDENKKAIVIGHSYGCSLATALARFRTQQIVQLILISGGGPTPLAAPTRNDDDLSVSTCLQAFLSFLMFCGLKRSLFYSSRGKHFKPCESNNGMPPYVLKYMRDGQSWNEGDAAFHRRILIPTLLVHGLQDTAVTLVQECEMERTIPRAFLELIPNAGHLSMLDTPEHLSHMILCFMDWWSR